MKAFKSCLYLLLVFIGFDTCAVFAQTKELTEEQLQLNEKDMQWFKDAKFGMFIH